MAKKTFGGGCMLAALGCVALPALGFIGLATLGGLAAKIGKPEISVGPPISVPADVSEPKADLSTTSVNDGTSPALASPDTKATAETNDEIEVPPIPGIAPLDVYGNMEKEGFKTNKTAIGRMEQWESKLETGDATYTVTAYGDAGKNNVWKVDAMAVSYVEVPPMQEIQRFFGMVASLPYKGSRPKEASRWVQMNWQRHRITKTVGKVEIGIFQGNRMVWMSMRAIR